MGFGHMGTQNLTHWVIKIFVNFAPWNKLSYITHNTLYILNTKPQSHSLTPRRLT
jgi:hypothetical protein